MILLLFSIFLGLIKSLVFDKEGICDICDCFSNQFEKAANSFVGNVNLSHAWLRVVHRDLDGVR